MRDYSFNITKQQYNYLLPVFGITGNNKLLAKRTKITEEYFFVGNYEEYTDMLNRCKYL